MAVDTQDTTTVTPEQALEVLKEKGYIIRTAEEDESHLAAHTEEKANTLAEKKMGEKWKTRVEEFETKIKSLTGIDKKPGENAMAFLERAVPELKSADLKRLEENYKAQLEAVNGRLNEKETEIVQIKGEYTKGSIKSDIQSAIDARTIALPGHLTTDEQKAQHTNWQKKSVVDGIMSKYTGEVVDGKVEYSLNGEVQRNKQDGKPLTASEIVERDFSFVFTPKESPKGGTGSGPNNSQVSEFTTKDEVVTYLKGKGMKVGTNEYMAAYAQLTKNMKD